MAKASLKKPKLTPEEQMAELTRLTGSVAAISHVGTSQPFVLPGAAPEAAPAPVLSPATPPVPAAGATPTAPTAPTADTAPAAPAPGSQVAPAAEAPVEDAWDEGGAEVVPPPAVTGDGPQQLDLTALFAGASEKKTFQIRITATHQQFFQQMGLLLGEGASSTDVIHNILAQFKAANEGQIQKAFQRQLRQLMAPKK